MTVKQERKIIEHEAKVTTSLGARITLLTEIQGRFKDGKENKMGSMKTKKQLFRNNLFSNAVFPTVTLSFPQFFFQILQFLMLLLSLLHGYLFLWCIRQSEWTLESHVLFLTAVPLLSQILPLKFLSQRRNISKLHSVSYEINYYLLCLT
jgi:hypothetical protein